MKLRPKLKAPVPVGSILQGDTKRRSLRLIDLYRIQKNWEEVVGKILAGRTFPKRIRGETLYVSVENSAWSQHLTLMKDQVLKALEERVSFRFSDLRFVNEPILHRPQTSPVAGEQADPKRTIPPSDLKEKSTESLSEILDRVGHLVRLRATQREKNRP